MKMLIKLPGTLSNNPKDTSGRILSQLIYFCETEIYGRIMLFLQKSFKLKFPKLINAIGEEFCNIWQFLKFILRIKRFLDNRRNVAVHIIYSLN